VVFDLDIVRARYEALQQALPSAGIYYLVKANPAPEVVSVLAALGSNFDLVSQGRSTSAWTFPEPVVYICGGPA